MNRRARFTFSMPPIILCTSIMSPLIHLLSKQNQRNLFGLPSHENPRNPSCCSSPNSFRYTLRRETKPQHRERTYIYVYVIIHPQHIPSLHHLGAPFQFNGLLGLFFGTLAHRGAVSRRLQQRHTLVNCNSFS